MTTLEILIAAKKKIENPEHWTTGALAKDVYGQDVDPCHVNAYSYCTLGAVYYFTTYTDNRLFGLLDDSAEELFDMSSPEVNDRLGHDAVMRVYDHVIEKAKHGTTD